MQGAPTYDTQVNGLSSGRAKSPSRPSPQIARWMPEGSQSSIQRPFDLFDPRVMKVVKDPASTRVQSWIGMAGLQPLSFRFHSPATFP
jgi:hypothetical protein